MCYRDFKKTGVKKMDLEEREQIKIIFEGRENNNNWQTGPELVELALKKSEERIEILKKINNDKK